jgi:hypothetical protein
VDLRSVLASPALLVLLVSVAATGRAIALEVYR